MRRGNKASASGDSFAAKVLRRGEGRLPETRERCPSRRGENRGGLGEKNLGKKKCLDPVSVTLLGEN